MLTWGWLELKRQRCAVCSWHFASLQFCFFWLNPSCLCSELQKIQLRPDEGVWLSSEAEQLWRSAAMSCEGFVSHRGAGPLASPLPGVLHNHDSENKKQSNGKMFALMSFLAFWKLFKDSVVLWSIFLLLLLSVALNACPPLTGDLMSRPFWQAAVVVPRLCAKRRKEVKGDQFWPSVETVPALSQCLWNLTLPLTFTLSGIASASQRSEKDMNGNWKSRLRLSMLESSLACFVPFLPLIKHFFFLLRCCSR